MKIFAIVGKQRVEVPATSSSLERALEMGRMTLVEGFTVQKDNKYLIYPAHMISRIEVVEE